MILEEAWLVFAGIEDDKSKFAQGKKTANAPYRRIQNYGEIKVLLLRFKKKTDNILRLVKN